MSDYFFLSANGAGSDEVESFPSYLCRLAKLHNVSLTQFGNHLAQWWLARSEPPRLPSGPLHQGNGILLCGVQKRLEAYVQAVESATGARDLERTTLLALRPAISSAAQGLIRAGRAWCPACLSEDKKYGTEPYDRLIWALQATERCPVHSLVLQTNCDACGVPQKFYSSGGQLDCCFQCKSSLIARPSSWRRQTNPSFGERDCLELVTEIARGEFSGAIPYCLSIFSHEILRLIHWDEYSATREKRRNFAVAIEFGRSKKQAAFTTVLRQAFHFGVRLVDILSDPESAASSAVTLFSSEPPPSKQRPLRGSNVYRVAQDRLRFELAKPLGEPLISYPSLWRQLGVSRGYLEYRFPKVVDRYKKRAMREREERIELAYGALRRGLYTAVLDFPSALFPSQDHLVSWAVAKFQVSVSVARREVRDCVRAHQRYQDDSLRRASADRRRRELDEWIASQAFELPSDQFPTLEDLVSWVAANCDVTAMLARLAIYRWEQSLVHYPSPASESPVLEADIDNGISEMVITNPEPDEHNSCVNDVCRTKVKGN